MLISRSVHDSSVLFGDVQTYRSAPEYSDLAQLAFDLYPRAPGRGITRSRDHTDLAGTVVHVVQLERYQRNPEAVRDHPGDANGLVVVPRWLVLQLGDTHLTCGASSHEQASSKNDGDDRLCHG